MNYGLKRQQIMVCNINKLWSAMSTNYGLQRKQIVVCNVN